MARLSLATRKLRQRKKMVAMLLTWLEILDAVNLFFQFVCALLKYHVEKYYVRKVYSLLEHVSTRSDYLRRLTQDDDKRCIDHLRMDMRTFGKLCWLLRTKGGLTDSKHVTLEEQVAFFLNILAHHKKNRVIQFDFRRSGRTVSAYFNKVLRGVIRLHSILLKTPKPIHADCEDEPWKWFKNCLGALDGTHIDVRVPEHDKPRYRNRKQGISTNVLAACSRDLQFIYVMTGWEGSAADGRLLRDAVSRQDGLRVPRGQFFLVDAGFTNCEGFLAPYRGQRYHLNEWRSGYKPKTPEEFFNMKHSKARNIIERCFGILNMRWAILRSASFYPICTVNKIIMACCLIHNLIRKEMMVDPAEKEYDRLRPRRRGDVEYIESIESTEDWKSKRDQLAIEMFNAWRRRRG